MDMHEHLESQNEPQQDANTVKAEFIPPRHWIGPEELEESYWKDPAVQEKRAQEFFEKPVEWADKIDRLDRAGLARREFLTIMGASMALASASCARRPVHKIIPYVVKPEEITLGVPTWYASTARDCGCGLLVKTREGRPIKLEGNPDHPVNQGALCSEGQASLLNLYDPERLKAPLVRSRTNTGSPRETSWNEVDAMIQPRLRSIAERKGKVRVLSGELQSPSTRQLIRDFLSGFGDGKHVEFDPLHLEEIAVAQEVSYGTAVIPHYHFEYASIIVSFGADFLERWLSPIEHARGWAVNRKLDPHNAANAAMSRLICFESTMTVTGANADERYPIIPGDEIKVALALAHELVIGQKLSTFANDPRVQTVLADYTPERVSREIGLKDGPSFFKKLAHELWEKRGKSLMIAGGVSSRTSTALSLQVVVNFLNTILENEGKTVDGTVDFRFSHSRFTALSQLVTEMQSGQVDALIVYRSNPAYTLPQMALKEAFQKVPLVIVVSDREDETAAWADFVLPDHHYLENWGDAQPTRQVFSLQQPVIAPLHSTRAFEDQLLTWGKHLGTPVPASLMQASDWHEYLKNVWKSTLFRELGGLRTFEQFWENTLKTGVLANLTLSMSVRVRPFHIESLTQLPKSVLRDQSAGSAIWLALYAKPSMGDGRNANNAWLQEMPDPITTVTWDNYVNLSSDLAKRLALSENDVVELKSGEVSVHLPIHIQPGMHASVVSVAVGYGRRAAGKVGNQVGVDVYPFVQKLDKQLIFSGQTVSLKKTGKIYKLASTQWHNATENRPIVNDITLSQFRKNPSATAHTDPHLKLDQVPTLWPKHEYKGHRWGMAIDLNSCTGCGACVIACQAENNVPVVGRDQVRVSRQMHWLRIDRYYSGSAENPDVVFQPMLCQHCENASCETVCPVLATVHDDEGLNVQVYNRCVGTRYCQNNCPYKVRRFNFFDHWKSYEGTMNLAWNPDVTVRTRGIMEKCTFCVQRIREAKDHAKDAGHLRVSDGAFQTACQQTCATQAITFGDLNDPKSRVAKMKDSPHAYRVLEILNNQPAISYMTKVRNKASEAHSS